MLPSILARMHRDLDAARVKMGATFKGRTQPVRGRLMTPQQMAIEHYADQMRFDDDARNADHRYSMFGLDQNYVQALKQAVAGSAPNDELAATVGRIVRHYQARGNTSVETGSPEWRELARALATAELEAWTRTAERDDGDFTGKPSHPILTEKPAPTTATDPLAARILGPDSVLPLSELVPKFLAERNISESSQHEHVVSARMIEEHLGEARPIYKITRRDVIDYKNALLDLPSNYVKRFPSMTLPQALKANKERKEPFPLLDPRTVNDKWLSSLRALLNWCVQNDVIPDSPATGIKANFQADKGKPKRVNFDPGDLTRIFSKPLFDRKKPWGETQWAYLVSLYCGTRPSELAQVKLDSIRHERGVLVIRVQEETKNTGSQRAIPVHSELVRLDFMKHVDALRKAGETHLFPGWYGDGTKSLKRAETMAKTTGTPVSLDKHFPKFLPRRFNVTYLKKVGIQDARKVFYSFRHTFKTGLAQAGVGKDIRDSLTGHADSSAGAV